MNNVANLDFSSILTEPALSQSSIIADYSEYSGESIDSIIGNINKHKNATAEEFNNFLSKNNNNKFETQTEFYKTSNSYIYDLLTINASHEGVANKLNDFIPTVLLSMKEIGSTFAEFGAGIGVICEIMYKWGKKKVTYIDIQSPITDFARWRFKRYNLDIEMIIIPQDDFVINRQFDVVFTDAVFEHITEHQQVQYASKLANMVAPDGGLVFIADAAGESLDMPMHYNLQLPKIFQQFQKNQLVRLDIPSKVHDIDYGAFAMRFATAWVKLGPNSLLQYNKE